MPPGGVSRFLRKLQSVVHPTSGVSAWLCVEWSVDGGLRDHPVSVVVVVWRGDGGYMRSVG